MIKYYMPKIPVSFKKTTRDMKLYTKVKKQDDYSHSDFVKNAIEYYIKYLNKKNNNL